MGSSLLGYYQPKIIRSNTRSAGRKIDKCGTDARAKVQRSGYFGSLSRPDIALQQLVCQAKRDENYKSRIN